MPPTYDASKLGTNTTTASDPCLFYCYWQEAGGLSGWILSHNNTGTLGNESWTSFGDGATGWSNKTLTLNSTVGNVVQWKFYANSSTNGWNGTMPWQNTTLIFDNEKPVFSNITYNNSRFSEPTLLSCYVTDNKNLSTCIISHNNTGLWQNVTLWTDKNETSAWGNYTITLNNTVGNRVGYMWYCNDTSNNWQNTTSNALIDVVYYPDLYYCHADSPTHGQNSGTGYDVGSLWFSKPTTQEIRYCVNWVEFDFDVSPSVYDHDYYYSTISNFYIHIWWKGKEYKNESSSGVWYPWVYGADKGWETPNMTASNVIQKTLRDYKLSGTLVDGTDFNITSPNPTYKMMFEVYNYFSIVPYALSSGNMSSFVIINLPSNTILQNRDIDKDGLTDYQELFTYYTDPADADTDDDGYNDYIEITYGGDALDELVFPHTDLAQGWNNFTVWTSDVAKTFAQINTSLYADSINYGAFVCEYNSTGVRYAFVKTLSFNTDVTVNSSLDKFYIYCNTAGTWYYTYP
jgi:hypothetical protein